jgi:hypothetical protein
MNELFLLVWLSSGTPYLSLHDSIKSACEAQAALPGSYIEEFTGSIKAMCYFSGESYVPVAPCEGVLRNIVPSMRRRHCAKTIVPARVEWEMEPEERKR